MPDDRHPGDLVGLTEEELKAHVLAFMTAHGTGRERLLKRHEKWVNKMMGDADRAT